MMQPRKIVRSCAGACALVFTLGGMAAIGQTDAAEIPASLHGTYSLEYSSAQDGSPVANGDTATLVLAPGGALCIADYVLYSPESGGEGSSEAIWTESSLGLQLAVSAVNGSFNEMNILNAEGDFLGQFTGQKSSDDTTCGPLGGTPPDPAPLLEIFDLAEQEFSDLFPPQAQSASFRMLDGFLYRYYVGTGIYIGISQGSVYLAGGVYGDTPVSVGSIASTLAQLQEIAGDDPVDDPVVDIPEGDFTLTIAGTASGTVQGAAFEQPVNIVIDSIDPADTVAIDNIEQTVLDAIAEATDAIDGTTISQVQVSEVDVGNDRVFFRIQFSATTTTQGVSVQLAYDLTYEYVRN